MKTFLNTLIIMAVFFSYSHNSFAQTKTDKAETKPATTAKLEMATQTKALNEKEASEFYLLHSDAAKKQVIEFLSSNIKYPEIMVDSGVEGILYIEVSVQKNGTIEKTKVAKSLNHEFDEMVLQIMKKFEKVSTPENQYYGSNRLLIPIKFNSNR